jgi:hypothetical protein
MTIFAHLTQLADRLSLLPTGSIEADRSVHVALGLVGPAPAYTCQEAAARTLLPAGFEWLPPNYSSGSVYAACRRSGTNGDRPHPYHGQLGHTLPLALCGAVVRARAGMAKG